MSECSYTLPHIKIECDNGLSQLEWSELKALLKQEEQRENYEFCILIQAEITARVEAYLFVNKK